MRTRLRARVRGLSAIATVDIAGLDAVREDARIRSGIVDLLTVDATRLERFAEHREIARSRPNSSNRTRRGARPAGDPQGD